NLSAAAVPDTTGIAVEAADLELFVDAAGIKELNKLKDKLPGWVKTLERLLTAESVDRQFLQNLDRIIQEMRREESGMDSAISRGNAGVTPVYRLFKTSVFGIKADVKGIDFPGAVQLLSSRRDLISETSTITDTDIAKIRYSIEGVLSTLQEMQAVLSVLERPVAIPVIRLPQGDVLDPEWARARLSTRAGSSPAEESKDAKGGIDLTNLPGHMAIQPMPLAVAGRVFGDSPLRGQSPQLRKLSPADEARLKTEWLQIENTLKAGIIPSPDRIRDYLRNCCASSAVQQEVDKVLSCLAQIMRMEEDRVENTAPALKDMLILLESDKPANEMQLVLAKLATQPKEPETIGK
ncbi:MAG: hypothetical protein WC478_06565, partial [Candidatus Omnitrophota bacterium]